MGRTTQFFAKAPGGPSKCSAWGQLALDFLEIHHFRTAKTVQIKDWRLGSLYWSAVTLIWAYVGWSLFLSRTYMESVPAVGTHIHWGGNWQASDLRWSAAGKCDADCGTADTYESASSLMYDWLNSSATGSFAYCNNSNYDFVWSPEFGYGPYFCTFQPFEELWTKMTEGLFFTTSMRSTKSKCFDVSGGVHTSDACDTAFAAANLSCAAGSYYRVSTCCCDEVAYTFPVAAEHMSMEFEHGFSSSYAQHIPSGKAYLPRTLFRLKSCIEKKLGSCDILEVPQGNLVTLPLQALFKLLAIDLDEDSCTQNGGKATDLVDGKCQKARVGGMHIELGISYYNFDQNAALKDDDPLCIIELDPTLTWTDIGSVVIIDREPLWAEGTGLKNAMQSVNQGRLGVKITLADKGGKIGRFNYVYFLNVLVNAVVMMGVADVIASLIAKFGLGKKSQMYNAAINERLSFSRELARFSAQALVAKNCFNAIDTDGDGTISQKELAEELKDVLKNEMDDEGVAAAARAVFRVLDHGASSEEQVGEDSTISLFELIETMQNDRLTWADLKFVMQEYAKLEQKLRHSQSQNSVSRNGWLAEEEVGAADTP